MSILPTSAVPSVVPSTMISVQVSGFQTPSPDSFRLAAASRGGEAVAAFQAPSVMPPALTIPTSPTEPLSPTFPSSCSSVSSSNTVTNPFAVAAKVPVVSPTKPRSPTKWVVDPNIPTAYRSEAPLMIQSNGGGEAPRLVTQYGLDRLATYFGF